jgi:hypothetical protein
MVGLRKMYRLLNNKNIKIPIKKNYLGDPPTPHTMQVLDGQGVYFQKLSYGNKTSDMTSEGLGEMFEGNFAEIFGNKFLLV